MIPNRDKTKETKKTRQAKNGERQETALLSDIVPLPDPRFRGRIGSTQGSTQAPGATVVSGPVRGTRITEPYARLVARDTYFWPGRCPTSTTGAAASRASRDRDDWAVRSRPRRRIASRC